MRLLPRESKIPAPVSAEIQIKNLASRLLLLPQKVLTSIRNIPFYLE
jgi:hypothetical protein